MVSPPALNHPKVAYSNPVAALEWCLLMQKAAMFLPWPQRVLEERGCRREDDAAGRVVFRGPRLKMGLREGVPKSICPDHLGRADYHGESINMAARFMDAAAHGGQQPRL
ncbi:hypothetical protein MNEG_15129 [Monoraphidium neglectum]|uniref:Guanylate cyclase domain-containing protein n=1 Tax=Monoraphidium neglectum TaxID=145388 RepID=A0A0D2LM00_9CHLO|nr:hypothetical protein MNEG_15129 [Monoraphidium neglectum]KIY92834.1 hypothetical protein MNEG_15129 [Monoraphidium neglectum]|eukprot:XP_013891854.1 hypothetical protein MNEG_15129 [Monoraphidium neglectum]